MYRFSQPYTHDRTFGTHPATLSVPPKLTNLFDMAWVLGLAVSFNSLTTEASPTQIIAVSGDAPSNSTLKLDEMGDPVLSRNGHIIFASTLRENGILRGSGILRASASTPGIQVIARDGTAAPDQNGSYAELSYPRLLVNAEGDVAFLANFTGTLQPFQSDTQAILKANATNGIQVMVRGDWILPGTNLRIGLFDGRLFDGRLALDDAGRIAFVTASRPGIYMSDGITLTKVAALDDPTPISPFTFRQFNDTEQGVSLSPKGTLLFGATDNELLRKGLYGFEDGKPIKFVRQNDSIPIEGGRLNAIHEPSQNSKGQFAFVGTLGLPNFATEDAILRWDSTALTPIARRGTFLPDGNGRLLNFGQTVSLNDEGNVLFAASITGSTNASELGVFIGNGATLKKVVRSGDPAPSGGTFTQVGPLALNGAGQVLFGGSVVGSESGTGGIFLYDPSLGILPIAWIGTEIPALGRITHLFFESGLGWSGNANAGFNDLGQVAYRCYTTTAAAILRWSPENLLSNRPPTSGGISTNTPQGQALTLAVSTIVAAATDPEGSALSFRGVTSSSAKGNPVTYDASSQRVTYQPQLDFLGDDEFTCVVLDDFSQSGNVTVRVTVTAPNKNPTTTGLTKIIRVGEALSLKDSEILDAVDDPEDDPLSIISISGTTKNGAPVHRESETTRLTPRIEVGDDQLNVEVGDGRGGTVVVSIYFTAPDGFASVNRSETEVTFRLSLSAGTWFIERAASPEGPWAQIGTVSIIPPPGGHLGCLTDCTRDYPIFRDPSPPSAGAFYRAMKNSRPPRG